MLHYHRYNPEYDRHTAETYCRLAQDKAREIIRTNKTFIDDVFVWKDGPYAVYNVQFSDRKPGEGDHDLYESATLALVEMVDIRIAPRLVVSHLINTAPEFEDYCKYSTNQESPRWPDPPGGYPEDTRSSDWQERTQSTGWPHNRAKFGEPRTRLL